VSAVNIKSKLLIIEDNSTTFVHLVIHIFPLIWKNYSSILSCIIPGPFLILDFSPGL